MQNATVKAGILNGIIVKWEQSRKVSTLLQVLLLIGIGVVASLTKKLQPSLGIPGSSTTATSDGPGSMEPIQVNETCLPGTRVVKLPTTP